MNQPLFLQNECAEPVVGYAQPDPVAAVFDRLMHDGGGTFEARTYIPFEPIAGFAVGVGGVKMSASDLSLEKLRKWLRCVEREHDTPFVGVWVERGLVYVDAVIYFNRDSRDRALAAGRHYNQDAIFDFATADVIYTGVQA